MVSIARSVCLFTLAGFAALAGPAEAQRGRPSARVVRAARMMTSPPLAQLAAEASAAPLATGIREINPLGSPPIPPPVRATAPWMDPLTADVLELAPAPAPYLSFDGVSNRNSVVPPDTNGDVGRDHYVQWVNLSLQIFDKTTGATVLGPMNGSALWSGFGGICESNNNGDPVVLYDHLADRWLLSQFGLGFDGHQCIAVSETGDPTGAYHLYDFLVTSGGANDYPKLGLWPDAYLYMANEFAPGFTGTVIGGFDREKLLAGDPTATGVILSLPPGQFGATHFAPEPANLEGNRPPPSGRPGLFIQPMDVGVWGGLIDRYNVWEVVLDFESPASSAATLTEVSAGVPPFTSNTCINGCVPQPGTSRRLDGLSQFTMFRPVYRNFGSHEVLLVNHTVDAGGGVSGIRWTEIRDPFGSPAVYQTGTHSPDARYRWMGSLAMDGDGNMLLGYSLSSGNTFPSIAYAGRMAGDPKGTLPLTESLLIGGSGSQSGSSRWGDYATMSVDELGDQDAGIAPDCGFWFTSEYVQRTGSAPWRTRIGAIEIPGCGAGIPPSLGLAVNGLRSPSGVVQTTSPLRVTLDMTPGTSTAPLDWYYGLLIGDVSYWVTLAGLSETPAPLVTAPAEMLDDAPIFDSRLPSGTVLTFLFFLTDGVEAVAVDYVTALIQ